MGPWHPPVLASAFATGAGVVFAVVLVALVGRALWAWGRAIRQRRSAPPIPDWAVALFGPEDAATLAAYDIEAQTAQLIAAQVRKLRRVTIVTIASATSGDREQDFDRGFDFASDYTSDAVSDVWSDAWPDAWSNVRSDVAPAAAWDSGDDYGDLVIDFADGTRLRLFHVDYPGIVALVHGLRVRGRTTLDALELRAGHVQCVLRRGKRRASLGAGGMELSRGPLGRR